MFLEGKSYEKFGIASGFRSAKDFEKQYESMLPHYKKFYPNLVHKPVKKSLDSPALWEDEFMGYKKKTKRRK
jgi:hypothetical protein